jgi:L-lactate dehydrogenase complex protein LldG
MHDPVAHFITECDRLKTTCTELTSVAEVPREAARYIAAEKLASRCVGWAEFAALAWADAGITFDNRTANGDDLIGLTGCYCAIGETGTLLLLGAPATPKATALLPETHICVVRKSRIVPTMEDAFALMRSEIGEPPRATFFVSGPSRTADIEQTIVIGAHGPYRVHVILVP